MTNTSASHTSQKKVAVQKPQSESEDSDDASNRHKAKSMSVEKKSTGKVFIFMLSSLLPFKPQLTYLHAFGVKNRAVLLLKLTTVTGVKRYPCLSMCLFVCLSTQ